MGVQFDFGVKRVVQRADHGLLNLCAAEVFAARHQGVQVKNLRVATPSGQVNAENFPALFIRREIHEEDFVQPALAQQLGRKLGNVIGGGDNEDRGGFLGKPGQK